MSPVVGTNPVIPALWWCSGGVEVSEPSPASESDSDEDEDVEVDREEADDHELQLVTFFAFFRRLRRTPAFLWRRLLLPLRLRFLPGVAPSGAVASPSPA